MTILPASSSEKNPFELLARPIQKWIRQQGWSNLRPIQAKAINLICGCENDSIITAATAGGKTEAAFLPLLSNVISSPESREGFDLVYIGPLKALITDQALRLDGILENTDLSVYPWHGDVSKSRKDKAIKHRNGVLLITPESLEAMFVLRGREIPQLFGGTQAVVIDELHTFLDSDRGIHLRSLLSRLDNATGQRVRRIGLSATLGEMELVSQYLNSENPDSVHLIADESSGKELRVQLRGYIQPGDDSDNKSNEIAISEHLFENLRGTRNLVFAGSRRRVEAYSDRLSRMCELNKVPVEFLPHHGSISRDRRFHVEDTLREGRTPLTAVCTSTLELGIDIGDVVCVGQIGAPFSVASLRQRLGRSGRRANDPSVLRMYIDMQQLTPTSNPIDRLRLELVQGIAMIELLIKKWCEPPVPGALNLSTLTHQILSVIAERGGESAVSLYRLLCEKGPFSSVNKSLFSDLLRQLGQPQVSLIEQSSDGLLLLGEQGERIVAHYGFYAVFQTPEEFRLLADGREIGTIPIDNVLLPGNSIVFAGRRWRVVQVDSIGKVIELTPSKQGTPPRFTGDAGAIHHVIRQKMRSVLQDKEVPLYLDSLASEALMEARKQYNRLSLSDTTMVAIEEKRTLLCLWSGTTKTLTLSLALCELGLEVDPDGAVLDVPCSIESLRSHYLPLIRESGINLSPESGEKLKFDKFHKHLSPGLLIEDALSSRLDSNSLVNSVDQLMVGV